MKGGNSMEFKKYIVEESLMAVELFAEGDTSEDKSKNTGACKNETNVNVNGCV